MRAFVIMCFVTVACADQLGYNYQPVDHSSSGLSSNPGGNFGVASNSIPSHTATPVVGSFGSQGPSGFSGSVGSAGQPTSDSPSFVDSQGELDKQFYTYSADEDDFNDPAASNQLANSVRPGLHVVFIKGPENRGFEDAALQLAKQAANQHTDIYVLNKQANIGDLANKLNNINKNADNKPDVHFVKYRTPEDAANAQRAIQNQYDALGGPSHNINGGNAPVLNFASQATAPILAASAPRNSYLPAFVSLF